MSTVIEHLKERRKAELQGIHQFWFPGESMLTTRDELVERIANALRTGHHLRDKVARLSRTQVSLLMSLLGREDYAQDVADANQDLEHRGTPGFEVESSARMLMERGFLTRIRPVGNGEFYEIPEELGRLLEEVFELGSAPVAPEDQLSQKRLAFEVEIEDVQRHADTLEDRSLRELVRLAIDQRGLLERSTPGVQEILDSAEEDPFPRPWREALEESGIGTIGAVSLKDFGILVDEPAVIVFQEWIQQRSRQNLTVVDEPDTVLESGVDLYTDLDRVAQKIDTKPPKLTREGRIPKRVYESLRGELCLPRVETHLEGDLAETLVTLALTLGIIETYGDEVRVHDERFRVWRKLDLLRRVEIIQGRFLAEHHGTRWSFHQEALRQILIEILSHEQPEQWVSLDALVALVVSTYLLELEERDVRGILRQRREDDFVRERLNSPFHRLGTDLTYWIVNRFLLLGVCELGYRDGRLGAFRLTALGKELIGMESDGGENRVLVNPNFEIILFCEGLAGMRLELSLAQFGERISAERIRRYQVTRDTIRGGIRSGLSLSEIRKILEVASEHPLPEPVLVALRDWGKDLDWVHVKPALLLTGIKKERAKELSQLLKNLGLKHQMTSDHCIVLDRDRAQKVAGGWGSFLDRIRSEGWLVRDGTDSSDSHLEDLEPNKS